MEISEENEENKEYKTSAKNQYVAAAVVSGIASLSIGTVLGFSAILIPQLVEEGFLDSDKSTESSWIASLSNLGQLGGSLITGVLSNWLGRRPTIILLCIPLLSGWLTIGLSGGSIIWICIGRVLQGVGIMSSVTQVYLVEIADAKRRGWIGGSGALTVSAGITFVYVLGAVTSWRIVCAVCGTIPVLVALIMPFLPETPNWLVVNDRKEDAYKSIRWLRGKDHDIQGEINSLAKASGTKTSNEQNSDKRDSLLRNETVSSGAPDEFRLAQSQKAKNSAFKELFLSPASFKPFVLLLLLFVLMQSTGTFAIIFYAVNVFQDVGATSNAYGAAILTGLLRTAGTFGGTLLLMRGVPRKKLMVWSAIFMGIAMFCLSGTLQYFSQDISQQSQSNRTNQYSNQTKDFLQSATSSSNLTTISESYNNQTATSIGWVPPLLIVIYMLSYGLGVGTVPWLLLGELCPAKVKGIASGCVTCAAFLTVFLVVKLFPEVSKMWGLDITYLGFGIICILMALFVYFLVPETKGKTMAELQALFER